MPETSFDIFGITEIPTFILCNPNREQLYSLGAISERKYSPRFNSLSELSFRADEYIDGEKMEYYDYLVYRRLIYLPGVGYFMIREVSEFNDGILKYKEIKCESLEVEFLDKKITLFEGTYKFYDSVNPQESLLYYLVYTYMPGWTIDSSKISSALLVKYRTFDVTDTSLYNLLMVDVEEAYECVFFFNTITKTLWAKTIEEATIDTGIYLSHNNLIQQINITESTDELVTSLTVLGGGGLDIRTVNPIGTNNIYNFTYFKNLNWMSQDLIDAITAWENAVSMYDDDYDLYVTRMQEAFLQIGELEAELAELEAQLAALEEQQAAYIQQNNQSELSRVTGEIADLTSQIDAIEAQIDELTNSETNPLSVKFNVTLMEVINDLCSFSRYFDDTGENSLLKQLQPFVIQSSYINENLTVNDIMSASAVIETSKTLMEQAQGVLDRISQPRYTFELDSVNFLAIPEFSFFQGQFELGAILYLEVETDVYSRPFLLGYDIDYDNPTNFKMIFGNRLRLNDEAFQFSDLLEDAISAGTETKVNSQIWNSWGDTYKDPVTNFISSSLNAALNNVISGSGQQILIDSHGLRGRKQASTGEGFDPRQLWMVNNMLAFTDDAWETAKMAIGNFDFEGSDGLQKNAWGIVADHLVGRMLIGNELYITNEKPDTGVTTFKVDATGATLINAYFEVRTDDNRGSIKIDPDFGITIKRDDITKFSADIENGDVILKGSLYAGTYSNILSSGTFQLGNSKTHLTFDGTTLDFNGTVSGALDWSSFATSLPSDKFASSPLGAGGTGYSGGGFAANAIPQTKIEGVDASNGWWNIYGMSIEGGGINSTGVITGPSYGGMGGGGIFMGNDVCATRVWATGEFAKKSHSHDYMPYFSGAVGAGGNTVDINTNTHPRISVKYGLVFGYGSV